MRIVIFLLVLIAAACGNGVEDVGEKDAGDQTKGQNIKNTKAAIQSEEARDSSLTGVESFSKEKEPPSGNWTDLSLLIPEAKLDIRYATVNNFVKKQLYECSTCWLRPDAAEALKEVQLELKTKGYGLVLFDCYRPRPVQQALWDIMPNAAYVTPPSRGSMHNRGKAVDLSLTDLDGNQLDMGTTFDFFGKAAHSDNRDHPKPILDRRDLLTGTMEKYGFQGIRTEWWHFSFGGKPAELSDELWDCD